MDDPIYFAAAVLAILVTPGPTNTLLATGGATAGLLRSLPLLLAEAAGYAITIGVTHYAIGLLKMEGSAAQTWMRMLAAIYLMWSAIKLWRRPMGGVEMPITRRLVFVTTLLNPKGLVFALVIIPFHAPDAILYVASLWIMLPAIGAAWIAGGAAVRRSTSGKHSHAFPKVAALVLGTFSTALIVVPLIR